MKTVPFAVACLLLATTSAAQPLPESQSAYKFLRLDLPHGTFSIRAPNLPRDCTKRPQIRLPRTDDGDLNIIVLPTLERSVRLQSPCGAVIARSTLGSAQGGPAAPCCGGRDSPGAAPDF
jgi:hypothetical protein